MKTEYYSKIYSSVFFALFFTFLKKKTNHHFFILHTQSQSPLLPFLPFPPLLPHLNRQVNPKSLLKDIVSVCIPWEHVAEPI